VSFEAGESSPLFPHSLHSALFQSLRELVSERRGVLGSLRGKNPHRELRALTKEAAPTYMYTYLRI
jgi:hypothetical protein